ENVERPRRDHELDLAIAVGDARHAGRPAQIGLVVIALAAFVRIGVEDRLVLGRERRLLIARPAAEAADRAPLAAEVWILRFIQGRGVRDHEAKRAHERDRTPESHRVLPCGRTGSFGLARWAR